MRIYIYRGGEKLVGRSGVGQAIRHQEARECMDFLIDVQQVMVWMMHEFA